MLKGEKETKTEERRESKTFKKKITFQPYRCCPLAGSPSLLPHCTPGDSVKMGMHAWRSTEGRKPTLADGSRAKEYFKVEILTKLGLAGQDGVAQAQPRQGTNTLDRRLTHRHLRKNMHGCSGCRNWIEAVRPGCG